MRIMVLGANGFIGRHVLAELLAHGHDVIAVVRRTAGLDQAFPKARFIEMDLANAVGEADWTSHLDGISLIVNAAGPWVDEICALDSPAKHRKQGGPGVRILFFQN